MNRVAIAVVVAVVGTACATSTKLTGVWKDPGAQSVRFNRVIVAFQSADQTLRRMVEDEMATRIARATAVYTVVSDAQVRDPAQAKAAVTAAGFDGAVVARLEASRTATTYVPGTVWTGPVAYGTMWGYWGYGWGAVYEPGYLVQDKVVSLESNVYSVTADKLLWSSRSDTFNPTSGLDLIRSVIAATADRMKREGLF